ncbi:MAG TPA: hypothetical protein PLX89_19980, partial [Verrucomicrobiota bacterium]|nr:hypothetical protein [Verrucomicrobiota bacterium]
MRFAPGGNPEKLAEHIAHRSPEGAGTVSVAKAGNFGSAVTASWVVGLRSTAAPFNSVWVVDFAMGNAGKGLARGTDQADLGGGRIHTRSGLDGDEVELVPTTPAWSDMVGLRSTAAPFNSVWVVDFA